MPMTMEPIEVTGLVDPLPLVVKRRLRLRWIVGGVVLAVAGIGGAVMIPEIRSSILNANESAAIAALKNLSSAQSQLQASGMLDRNGDGNGEYGYFAELSGAVRLPGKDEALHPPLLSQTYRKVVDGRLERSGYLFAMILPDAQLQAVWEGPNGGRAGQEGSVDPGHAETAWGCYAWPASQGRSGKRTFFINQSGDILATNGRDDFKYDGTRLPVAPDAAFARSSGRHMASAVAANTVGNDGNIWVVG